MTSFSQLSSTFSLIVKMVLIVFCFCGTTYIYDKQYKQNRYYRADVESPATEYRTQLIHNQRDRIGQIHIDSRLQNVSICAVHLRLIAPMAAKQGAHNMLNSMNEYAVSAV